MQIQFCTLTPAATTSNVVTIDLSRFRNGAGLLATVGDGVTVSYAVQLSGDNVNWNNHDVLVNRSTSANGNLAFPVRLIRLFGTAVGGNVVLAIIQAA